MAGRGAGAATQRPGSGRTALITGASAGIGAALARQFAKEGFDLILTARRQERLDALGAELSAAHGVTCHAITADLAAPGACQGLYDEIAARGLTIDALVNNAGYSVPKTFAQASWAEQRDVLQVLVGAVVEMSHLVLPAMLERGYGRILNVASVAGLMPGTITSSLYGAAKSFVIKFSESLFLECEGTGVQVCAVCPGFTHTEFHDVNDMQAVKEGMPKWMWMDADTVARQGYDAVMAGKTPRYTNGFVNRMLINIAALLPYAATLNISRRRSNMQEGD